MSVRPLRLLHHPEDLAVVRFDPHAVVPDWAMDDAPLVSVTVSSAETSVVCLADSVPREVARSGPHQAFEMTDQLDISFVGALAMLLNPVAEAGISAFNVSTFTTTWILVPSDRAGQARAAWAAAGHTIDDARPILPIIDSTKDNS